MKTMDRRRFLHSSLAAGMLCALGDGIGVSLAAAPVGADYRRLLVLIELKGGNDGLNTLVPYTDSSYYALRPKLAVARDAVVQLSDRTGLHPSLAPLLPLWTARELAVLQGLGYPAPNLSHFRSIEIWDTASKSDEYLQEGWLTRTFAAAPTPGSFAADGVIIGTPDLGPLTGGGTRAIALANTDQFLRQARLATPEGVAGNRALAHILKVEADIVQAASHLGARRTFTTEFPASGFGNAIRTAAQVIATPAGVAVVRITLSGFDTHTGQAATQARLLGDLAAGIVALRSALVEIGRWNDALVLTYAEFGRRPKENLSNGTDHGTASVHFAAGGRVHGGLHGEQPSLARLDGDGNMGFAIDFRSAYATVLERWWNVSSAATLGGRFQPLPFLAA
jgi:uncharacterized protein (DUF1501 family)